MRKFIVTVVGLLATIVIAGGAYADGSSAGAPRLTSLSGPEEVPTGDPDGTGFARVTLNVGQGRVCWDVSWAGIDAPAAAHIHVAPAGVAGPVVVPFWISPPAVAKGCRLGVDPALVQAIIDFPDRYYVNLHNGVFPLGAIRGQLSVPGEAD